jgi:transposase
MALRGCEVFAVFRFRLRATQYSADFNPIEQALSKLKVLLRKAAERTVPNLQRRIAKLLPCFTATECANFLAKRGLCSNMSGIRSSFVAQLGRT